MTNEGVLVEWFFQGNKGRRWRRSQRYELFAVHTGRLTSRAAIDAWCTTVGLPTKAEAEARAAATLAARAAARAEELRLRGTAADPDDDDPYRGSSVDCTYDKPGDSDAEEEKRELRERERRRQQEGYVTLALRVQRGVNSTVARGHASVQLKVTKADYMNFPEQEMEQEMDLRERIAIATGRPWHEAPEDVRTHVLRVGPPLAGRLPGRRAPHPPRAATGAARAPTLAWRS